jgi:hypothetical protein
MKLIIQNNKVIGTATDDYDGPGQFITAPADFDVTRMSGYVFANGAVTITPSGLDWTKAQQIALLSAAYANAIVQAVSYTTKAVSPAVGITKTYQADPQSVSNLQSAIAGCSAAQATPTGFYWVAFDNTQVPFAFADLQGLAAAMFGHGAVAFQHLQTQKAAVNAATTVSGVQAVVW